MNTIWILAKRELNTFFDSLIAYILIIIFLGATGFATWLFLADIFLSGQASLQQFFFVAFYTLGFFFIPALTMRMLAEEKRSGTIELLLTKAVTDWQIVLGKFVACMILVLVAIAFSLPYYFTVTYLGDVDHGAVWSGYFGLLLYSSALVGIGIYTSSITSNQIVAFLMALTINLFLLLIFSILAGSLSGSSWLSNLFYYLSSNPHYESFTRGVIDSKDMIYFISIAVLCLFMAEASLAKRNVAT